MNIVPCTIMGFPALVAGTDQNEAGTGNHDRRVMKIGAAVRLRDEFNLSDGDTVTIEIVDS